MNTRQKLTLGIAAIFMVTLTIVGVTYAYFVTRVTGDNGKETVNVQTAEIASIEYDDGNGIVNMKNVLPGETVYKSFKVTNADKQITGIYEVYLSALLPEGETVEFVHTNNPTSCYTETAYDVLHNDSTETAAVEAKNALKTACYVSGTTYNSIKYTLYRVSELPVEDEDGNVTLDTSKIVIENENQLSTTGFVPYGKTASDPAILFANVSITPSTETVVSEHYYVLQIDYVNAEGNQNIEQEAALDILVDIVKR